MRIGKRLVVAFVLAIIISSIAGAVGVGLLNKIDSDYSNVLENYGFAQGELGNLGRRFQSSRALNMDIVTAASPAEREKYVKELAVEDELIKKHMAEVKGRLGTELGQQTYKELDDAMNVFFSARELAFRTTENSKDINMAVATYHNAMEAPSEAVRGILDTMVNDKTTIGHEKSVGLSTQTAIFTWLMIGVMVVAFVVAIILAIIISNGISKPIDEINEAAVKISKGDYDVSLTHHSKDEVGELADSMRTMTSTTNAIIMDAVHGLREVAEGNFNVKAGTEYVGVFAGIKSAIQRIIVDLSNTMAQIKSTSDQVASGSEQVSSGAQALAQGATEQASSVEELSASVNEVSAHIKRNAENAQAASNLADTVGGQITVSNEQMGQMMSAMTEISESSSHISRIIKTIEDIAFQTNILALNAAVEAARAGAAGKGFAVVADEVRNLATKSSEAAKQTNGLIEGSVKSVENGVKIAGETAKSLNSVVTGAVEITRMINEITRASSEQATSIAQINQGVEQISSVVQTNSATSEESAAASEELSGQANIMRELVAKFQLLDGVGQQINLMDEPIKYQSVDDDNTYTGSKY